MFQRKIKLIATVFICFAMFIQAAALPISAATATEPKLLVMGDSTVTGYGLPDYNTGSTPRSKSSWAALLTSKLGYKLINGATDGQSTEGLLSAAKGSSYTSAIKSADTICICIGSTDLMNVFEPVTGAVGISEAKLTEFLSGYQSMLDTAVKTASSNIGSLIKYIKGLNSKAVIIIQTLYNPFEYFDFEVTEGKTADDISQAAVEQLNKEIRSLAASYKISVCDVFAAIDKSPSETYLKTSCKSLDELLSGKASFDINPTAKCHSKISELMYNSIGTNGGLYEFTGFKVINDITIGYGTKKEDIPMPKTITIATSRGNIDVEVTSWDLSGYIEKSVDARTVEAVAKYTMPSYVVNEEGLPTKVTANIKVSAAPSITKIVEPQAITGIASGTGLDYIGLPTTVMIIAGENRTEYAANVKWDTSAYDTKRTDAYTVTLTGTVTLPEGISNESNLPLTTSITLSVNAVPSNTTDASETKKPDETTGAPQTEPADTTPNTNTKSKGGFGKVIGTIFIILLILAALFFGWVYIVSRIKAKRRRERRRLRRMRQAQLARENQQQYYPDEQGYPQGDGYIQDGNDSGYYPDDQYYQDNSQGYYPENQEQYSNTGSDYDGGYNQAPQDQGGNGEYHDPLNRNQYYKR